MSVDFPTGNRHTSTVENKDKKVVDWRPALTGIINYVDRLAEAIAAARLWIVEPRNPSLEFQVLCSTQRDGIWETDGSSSLCALRSLIPKEHRRCETRRTEELRVIWKHKKLENRED